MSAVRSRIASLEAASSKAGGFPSPSRPIPNRNDYRKRNNLTPQKKTENANNTADTSLNNRNITGKSGGQVTSKPPSGEQFVEDDYHDSASVTASENRKSRIRQSQQQTREKTSTPTTNLSEMRRQRRILQSQRRLKTKAADNTSKETEGDGTTSAGNVVDSSRVSDSPGDFSTSSNSRWSKLSRLQRKPNGINHRQSSAATNVSRASMETSVIRNTAAAKLGSRNGTKAYGRRQESPKNSSSNHRSVHSNYGGGVDQQQLNASLEAPTDDDATLTSVHRIMDNSKHARTVHEQNQSQGHTYETLQPQHTSISARNKYDNHNSYDSSVGPSWKLNRGTGNRNTIWKEEEKSDKIGRVLRTDYSSDYDMDDKSRQSTHFAEGPVNSQNTDVNDYYNNSRYQNANNMNGSMMHNNRRIDDDDRTFDYGDRDDESNGGTSFQRRRREAEQRRARMAASNHNDMNKFPDGSFGQSIIQAGGSNGNNGEPMLLSKDDMEHLTMNDSPSLRLSAGVAAVATVGLCVGGPVGLLAGVAAGGLSFGYMQIPEEERKKIQAKAEKAVHSLQEKACDASEAMSASCINTYQDSGVAEHVPQCISSNIANQLVPNCPTGGTSKSEAVYNAAGGTAKSVQSSNVHNSSANKPEHPSNTSSGPLMEQKPPSSMSHNERIRVKKVACLRNVRILPIAQIHGLEPSSQPRAWLDVVASANTSNEQKNEAMEEILLLAKDKQRAKIFLDEGILDYIIWTISRYIEKVEAIGKNNDWAFPEVTSSEKTAANLAAMCCVTLGKAHCAAIHTEGDLLLMSMYERGTVPEERQVAQMLHEVPHHARVTKTNDPTVVQPSKEVFAPRQLTLFQAEELARSIKLVASGQM